MKEIMRALRRLKGQREDAVETLADTVTRKMVSPRPQRRSQSHSISASRGSRGGPEGVTRGS
eukprot:3602083-Pyramimonas_sp.AAC.1